MLKAIEEIQLTTNSSREDLEKFCAVMKSLRAHYASLDADTLARSILGGKKPQYVFYAKFENGAESALYFHDVTDTPHAKSTHRILFVGARGFESAQQIADEVWWNWCMDKFKKCGVKTISVSAPLEHRYDNLMFGQAISIVFTEEVEEDQFKIKKDQHKNKKACYLKTGSVNEVHRIIVEIK